MASIDKISAYRQGMLVDISERGLCLKAQDTFYVQRLLSIYLKFTTQSSGIKILGKTVWTAPAEDGWMRVGIQFIGTMPTDWRQIILLHDNRTPVPA